MPEIKKMIHLTYTEKEYRDYLLSIENLLNAGNEMAEQLSQLNNDVYHHNYYLWKKFSLVIMKMINGLNSC